MTIADFYAAFFISREERPVPEFRRAMGVGRYPRQWYINKQWAGPSAPFLVPLEMTTVLDYPLLPFSKYNFFCRILGVKISQNLSCHLPWPAVEKSIQKSTQREKDDPDRARRSGRCDSKDGAQTLQRWALSQWLISLSNCLPRH